MSLFIDYNLTSRFYDDQRGPAGSDVMAAMLQFYTDKSLKDLRVLDAGCGTGNYTKSLLDIGVGQMALLDSSSEMLEAAKVKLVDYIAFGKVLNHLDPANSNVPNCLETLKESRRILRSNGVIVISTVLPSTLSDAMWFMKLNMKLTKRFIENAIPSLEQHEEMFVASGIKCVQKLNILGSNIYKNYFDVEGPSKESWLRNIEYMSFATESEADEVFAKIEELKANGELESWMKENDHTNTFGQITIFVCKPEK